MARAILVSFGYDDPFIAEVCTIIASHHSPGEVESDNFRVIWDADWLVNLGDECDLTDQGKAQRLIEKTFMTVTGKRVAEEIHLSG